MGAADGEPSLTVADGDVDGVARSAESERLAETATPTPTLTVSAAGITGVSTAMESEKMVEISTMAPLPSMT